METVSDAVAERVRAGIIEEIRGWSGRFILIGFSFPPRHDSHRYKYQQPDNLARQEAKAIFRQPVEAGYQDLQDMEEEQEVKRIDAAKTTASILIDFQIMVDG
ncbi:MAG: hypothetical protein KDD19_27700 [Phaeodactylibacter sp.]|nr:hypothetical protein [Phaeodactylibacter sp.]MCB9051027.1 hypothetical protein [Lewinellaceae bacterium]